MRIGYAMCLQNISRKDAMFLMVCVRERESQKDHKIGYVFANQRKEDAMSSTVSEITNVAAM